MSCWVSLSVASQFWNVPVSDLLSQVSNNSLTSRMESGMLLIDLHRPMNNKTAAHESQIPQIVAEVDADTFGDWRAARAATSRTRKAPVLHG